MESSLKYLSLFRLLNGVWQQKLTKIRKTYEKNPNPRLPSCAQAEELCYQLMMRKVRLNFEEHFVKEIEYIDQRNTMVNDILNIVFSHNYCRLYGGIVRDYITNNESFFFLKFNDFDVKCCSTVDACEIITLLEKTFGTDCVEIIRSTEIKYPTFCSVKTVLIKHKTLSLVFSMDLVSNSNSKYVFKRSTLFKGHVPDFDVNQLYLGKSSNKKMIIKSLVKNVKVKEIREQIKKRSFAVFTNSGNLVVQHKTSSSLYFENSPIYCATHEYKPCDNDDCLISDRTTTTFIRTPYSTKVREYSSITHGRGTKILERIHKMQNNGWTCVTHQHNFCENPHCIFSKDGERTLLLKQQEIFKTQLNNYYTKQLKLEKLRAKRERMDYIKFRKAAFNYCLSYDQKFVQEKVYSKKTKSANIEERKKTYIGKKNKKKEKTHALYKHSDMINDRFVMTKKSVSK
jgi:hypothetical protein